MTDSDLTLLPARQGARAALERGGAGACLAAEEFFVGQLRNPHTRRAYSRHVLAFLDALAPSIANQRMGLAALWRLVDRLVTRHAVLLNPFDSVQGPPRASLVGALALWFFLGTIWLHRFYLHRRFAIPMLLLGLLAWVGAPFIIGFFLLLPTLAWWLVDLFLVFGWVRNHNAAIGRG